MLAALGSRGPDAYGVFYDTGVFLGHTRLSIIDPEGGAQPLSLDGGRYWIVFNGEIYNYVELKRELVGLGYSFRTESDTEVLLAALVHWQTAYVEHLNGQWAFAAWDRAKRELTLGRDPHGIRPLYYTYAAGVFRFASTIRTLFCDYRVPRSLDSAGVAEHLTFWGPVNASTAFEGVYQLPPGSTATIPLNGSVAIRPEWAPSFPAAGDPPRIDEHEATYWLEARLVDSVRLRFERSDVPVGVYLSGGLDSSTIAIILSALGKRFTAYSLGFTTNEYDESDYQDELAQALGITVDRVMVSPSDVGEAFAESVLLAEQPLVRTAPAPLLLLAQRVRESGLRAVLTGEGADELFGGYDLFREHLLRSGAAGISTEGADAARSLYSWQQRSPMRGSGLSQWFLSSHEHRSSSFGSHIGRWRTGASIARFLEPHLQPPGMEQLKRKLLATLPEAYHHWGPLEQAQYLELALRLPGYILSAQSDRQMMGRSVEGRFPFLDPTVAAFALSLPSDLKIRGMTEKHLLKRVFGPQLPPRIAARSKQPYRAPDAPAFLAAGRLGWFEELLHADALRVSGVLRPAMVGRLIAKARACNGESMSMADNMRVVAVASIALLQHHFVDSFERPSASPTRPRVLRMTAAYDGS